MTAMWASDAIEAPRADPPASVHSEEDFVERLMSGRPEAFELLFALYRTPIYNLAVRTLHDAEEAEDATQETFLKAFEQIPRQNGDFQLEPWLYRVAVNTCFDHLRARRRRPTTPLAEQNEQASPTDQFAQAETGRLVEETLRRLSERHRVALVLKDLHGFTHEEIAEVLGISRGAAETLLFRARESFRGIFEGLSPAPDGRAGCVYARSVALALVGRDVSPLQKRELVEHAKGCPACRRSLQLRGGLALGLGLFIRELAPPAAMGSSAAFAAAAPPAAATLSGAASAGVLTKVAALFAGKAAIVTIAAAGVTLAGGAAAYTQLHDGHSGHRQGASAAAVVVHATGHGSSSSSGRAAAANTGHRGSHGRSLAAHAKAKGKAGAVGAAGKTANKSNASSHRNDGKVVKTGSGKQRGTATGKANGTTAERPETPATSKGH